MFNNTYNLSGLTGTTIFTPTGYSGTNYTITYIPTGYSGTNYTITGFTGTSDLIMLPFGHTGASYGTDYKYSCKCCQSKYIENNDIVNIGTKIIPSNAEDAITFENINEGDILIDFKRDNNKTEYDCGAYYKESTLNFILQSKKNQFTMEGLDYSSIVKYVAKYE